MSKETRIGLVVGLLFIIMFGLVLAGILNTKPPTDNSPPAGGVAMVANAPANGGEGDREYGYIPTTPAMDAEHHPAPAVAAAPARPVSEGPATTEPGAAAGSGSVEVALARPDSGPMPGAEHGISVPAPMPADDARVTETGGGVRTGPIEVELPPGALTPEDARGVHPGRGADVARGDVASPAGASIYEVKQGDSLYKIAAQLWGPKNASKNSLILAANKDKIKSANNLKVGMKLVIPPLPVSPAAAPAVTPTPTSGPSTPAPRSRHERSPSDVVELPHSDGAPLPMVAHPDETPAVAAPVAAKTYTIKSGDTILRLARTYRTSVDKILEMNKGVNPTRLKVGQKLTIPS